MRENWERETRVRRRETLIIRKGRADEEGKYRRDWERGC